MKNGIKFNWREFAKMLCGLVFFVLLTCTTPWVVLIGLAFGTVAALI